VVTLNGIDYDLGPYSSAQPKTEYDRVTAEWLIRGRRPPLTAESDEMLVDRGNRMVGRALG
jgi:hypothetical protein